MCMWGKEDFPFSSHPYLKCGVKKPSAGTEVAAPDIQKSHYWPENNTFVVFF